MGTVTEGLIFRLAAAAEGDSRLVRGDLVLGSGGIDDGNRSLNKQRAVIADGDRSGHGTSLGWSVLMEVARTDTYINDAACLDDVESIFPSRSDKFVTVAAGVKP